MILPRTFYQQDTNTVTKNLLGKILVHETAEGTVAGRIVETEAYRGPEDLAAHSSGGRRTARNEVMYGEKGHAYVYFIYGLYFCFNVTAGNVEGKPEAVLFRALEPVEGEEIMFKRRKVVHGKVPNLANGPSRLCMAMDVTKAQNGIDMTTQPLYILDAPAVPAEQIVETTRIGVEYGKEYKDKPWRYYIRDNMFVSKV
ncbi:MAG: DNA-3-methyladenine glycosylase [Candidatus Bathyarchaeota archaeon]|nr:DNA-3-methyladenine glycosylase [Candidatus Bathyarchaeota archaeon]